MSRAVLLALTLGLVIGLVSGLTLASRRAPIAAVREGPGSASRETAALVDRACRAQLASVKAQLVICNAPRPAEPEASPTSLPSRPDPGWDEETRRLVESGETNTTRVNVRTTYGTRMYGPGEWPPPGGPPPGARIQFMSADGGNVWYPLDGGAPIFHPVDVARLQSMYCPCPAPDAGAPATETPSP